MLELKPLPRGIQMWNIKRTTPPPVGVQTVCAGYLGEITWAKIQPTPDTFDTTLIENVIRYADNVGIPHVAIRATAGRDAPQWVKDAVGTIQYFNPQGETQDEAKSLPKFWTAQYWELYEKYWRKLAETYDNHPKITHVYNALGMTRFDEPLMRGIASSFNVEQFRSGGYTFAQDMATQVEAFRMHRRWWYQTRLATAFNPWQDAEVNKTRPEATVELISKQIEILGHQSITQNNSMRTSFMAMEPKNPYTPVYNAMIAVARDGYPVAWQTAGNERVGDLRTILQWGADLGACVLEPASNYVTNDLDDDFRRTIESKLVSNTALYPTPSERLTQLQTEKSNLESQITSLQGELSEVKTQIVDAQSLKHEYEVAAESYEVQFSSLCNELYDLANRYRTPQAS